MERKKVDLTTLPVWLQYTISLGVVALVVLLALTFGSTENVPAWVTKYLIPFVVIIGLVVLITNVLTWIKKKMSNRFK